MEEMEASDRLKDVPHSSWYKTALIHNRPLQEGSNIPPLRERRVANEDDPNYIRQQRKVRPRRLGEVQIICRRTQHPEIAELPGGPRLEVEVREAPLEEERLGSWLLYRRGEVPHTYRSPRLNSITEPEPDHDDGGASSSQRSSTRSVAFIPCLQVQGIAQILDSHTCTSKAIIKHLWCLPLLLNCILDAS